LQLRNIFVALRLCRVMRHQSRFAAFSRSQRRVFDNRFRGVNTLLYPAAASVSAREFSRGGNWVSEQ